MPSAESTDKIASVISWVASALQRFATLACKDAPLGRIAHCRAMAGAPDGDFLLGLGEEFQKPAPFLGVGIAGDDALAGQRLRQPGCEFEAIEVLIDLRRLRQKRLETVCREFESPEKHGGS